MSLSTPEPVPTSAFAAPPPFLPRRRPITRAEFEHLARIGFFGPDEHVELIEGEIVEKMTQNSPHATALRLTEKALNRAFGEGFDVRPQMPLALDSKSQPEPDVAVVTGSPYDYQDAHPSRAVLVVEVSDTTLAGDRGVKTGLYARAGIGDYWIVNLPDRVLEVYREPTAMPGQPLDHGYRTLTRLLPGDTVAPLAAPDAPTPVSDLLPRPAAAP